MSVSTYAPTTSGNTAKIDGNFAVLSRLGDPFAPHSQSAPDMTVRLDAGHVFDGVTLTEVAAQNTGTITAPASDTRIDRVVINRLTGVVSVVTGTASASPVAPAIPANAVPVAQVLLASTSTVIENGMITDERDLNGLGVPTAGGQLLNVQTFTSSGTYTPTTGARKVIVEAVGGGGSGGGCPATNASQGTASAAGAAGSYGRGIYPINFSSVTVTVGTGGASPTAGGNLGNSGSASSFGSLLVCPGGDGGLAGVAGTGSVIGGASTSGQPTGANIVGCPGVQGGHGICLNSTWLCGGTGGASFFGGGGSAGQTTAGADAPSFGAGGGGSSSQANKAAKSAGKGANGIVVVYEYA